MCPKKIEYKIGETVVYPKHGVGEIISIESMQMRDRSVPTAHATGTKPDPNANYSATAILNPTVRWPDTTSSRQKTRLFAGA